MKKGSKVPEHCKGCTAHWSHGIKDGKHNNWCCHFGQPAPKAEAHCRNVGGKTIKGEE